MAALARESPRLWFLSDAAGFQNALGERTMEIKRIDPYLVEWSVDGAVAVASEAGGIQLLLPDPIQLLRSDIQWRRMRSPELSGRVIDMKWSPTGQSTYSECVLAYVLDSGEAAILENSSGQSEPWVLHALGGDFTACVWKDHDLILGDNEGRVHARRAPDMRSEWTSTVPSQKRVVRLFTNTAQLGAVLDDNSVWLLDFATDQWELAVPASRFRAFAAEFSDSGMIVARTDSVITVSGSSPAQFSGLSHFVPGHLIVCEDEWAVVHTDGRISRKPASNLSLPEIKGRVFGASIHPYLPLGLLLIGPTSSDWEYPIVSWQWAKTAFFTLNRRLPEVPRIIQYASQMYWMTMLITEQTPIIEDVAKPSASSTSSSSLQASLEALFTSKWFDSQRLRWYLSSAETRPTVVAAMRSQIARLVCAAPVETELDEAIVRWYAAFLDPADSNSTKLEETELKILNIKGDVVEEAFNVESEQSDAITSQGGRIWKRCALTLIPLLSLNTRVSLDHEFSAYKQAPGESAIATALLEAGRFCVFSGTQWERPRF